MHRLACALVLASSSALAAPITVGAGLGITQDEVSSSQDPSSTLAVFGRLGLSHRLAAELDFTKVDTAANSAARTVTGYLVLDLGSNPRWVPQLFAGAGIDRADAGYGEIDGHHFEGGLGLEYRAESGFTIGARFHLGGRSIDSQPLVYPVACCTNDLWSPNTLEASQYRSLDAYAGVRF